MAKSSQIIRLMQLNAENLFLFLDRYEGEDLTNIAETQWQQMSIASVSNKPITKTRWLAESITQSDPDIVLLNEVGGLESLENFNKLFLQDQFECHLKEGNSDRGIDIGYLVQKRINLKPLLLSHKNRSIHFNYPFEANLSMPTPPLRLSRDVAELRLFGPQSGKLQLVLLGVHLKSKLDPEGIDPEGTRRRQAEFKTLLKIYNEILQETEGKVPVVALGDFNGQARASDPDKEFSDIRTTDLLDIFDLATTQHDLRSTQLQFRHGQLPIARQIDYIFLSKHLHNKVRKDSAKVIHYKNDMGVDIVAPFTSAHRSQIPSDHFPVVVDLEIEIS